jgi:hypothetical protein
MGGARMQLAQKALLLTLKGLPTTGTTFNLVSFGSNHTSLWPKSSNYTESTLQAAIKHVDSMTANYGGTEINSALDFAFKNRDTSRPTNVVLFTDGGSYDVEQTYDTVRQAVKAAKPNAPLRVYSFGIGESIARQSHS